MGKRVAAILFLTAIVGALLAAGSPASPFASPTKQFFAVSVPDAATAAEWYGKVFAVQVQRKIQAPDGSASVLVLASDTLVIEVLQHKDARPITAVGSRPAQAFLAHGIFKVGLYVSDFEAAVTHLRSAGVDFLGEPAEDGEVRYVLFRDVAGNVFQVFGAP